MFNNYRFWVYGLTVPAPKISLQGVFRMKRTTVICSYYEFRIYDEDVPPIVTDYECAVLKELIQNLYIKQFRNDFKKDCLADMCY